MVSAKWKSFWKVLRGRLIVSFLLVTACFVFVRWVLPLIYQPPAVMVLREAGEHQFLRLRKNLNDGTVQSLKIKLSGHLNGTAILRIFEDGNTENLFREKVIGSGKIDGILMDEAWFEDDCRIEYEPLSATHGELQIEYAFKTAKPRAI